MNDKKLSIDVTACDGKYKVIMPEGGELEALRYDKPWRDLTGDNLIYWLAVELQKQNEKIKAVENCLVCAAIENPIKVVENAYSILIDKE